MKRSLKLSAQAVETVKKNRLEEKDCIKFCNLIGKSWLENLKAEIEKPYFKKLEEFLTKERTTQTIFPSESDVFSWTDLCDFNEVKVIILGQDPYHDDAQAHGLAFSVRKGIKVPPSLVNIYKELCTDINGFSKPSHGYLVSWAKQGVLLLNTVLTVRAHEANSHSKSSDWATFTNSVIQQLSRKLDPGAVFLLWGLPAQKKQNCIDPKKHHILKAAHPSPLSASRGFFGCKHFSKANELLAKSGRSPIDWTSVCNDDS